MLVIYVLSFQGENGGVTFPMVGFSLTWFKGIFEPGQMANIPVSFSRSIALATVVSTLTVVISVAAGLGFRRRFPGSGVLFYLAVASLVMPSLLVGFGIGLGFQFLGIQPSLFTSALGAQLTWTLPFGLFAMFAVVNRFNRSWEEAATDLGANAWQRLRYVTIPILLPGIIGVAMGAFTLSYDEYARTTLTIGPKNTLPLEIYALISSATSPTLFAIGTLTDHGGVVPGDHDLAGAGAALAEAARNDKGWMMDTRFDVELVSVTKRYGTTLAVDAISLRIPRGTYCCLLGPSGCGKTTTLRMIAGHEAVTEGDILIHGENVSDLPPIKRGTAMMFQSYALFPHMSCLDNVAFSLKMRGVAKAERHKRAREYLGLVHMADYADRLPAATIRWTATADRVGSGADQPASGAAVG